MIVDKFLLWGALITGTLTYSFWSVIRESFNIPIFYVGNSLFVFLICLFLLKENKGSLIRILLFTLSLSNLIDELFFDPTQIQLNEVVVLLILPILWLLRKRTDA